MFYISSFTAEHSQAWSIREETWYMVRSRGIYGKDLEKRKR